MQNAQVMNAVETDVSASRDDGAAMANALHRLASLRATIYRDWSDGPSSLVAHANEEAQKHARVHAARAYACTPPNLAFAEDANFTLEPPALELRGRFDCLDDMPAPAAVAPPELTEEAEDAITFGAVGAAAGLAAFLSVADLPSAARVLSASPAPSEPEPETVEAYGAVAGLIAWLDTPQPQAAPEAPAVAVVEEDQQEDVSFAVGAVSGALALDAPELPSAVVVQDPPVATDDVEADVFALGGIADCLAFDAPLLDTPVRDAPVVVEFEDVETDDAIGAVPFVGALLALAPPIETFTPPPVIDLEEVAFDDFLADACEALYVAALDPTENEAWGQSVLAGADDMVVDQLAACETAFWNLPRVIPCGEAFTLNPNHEIAVKITRALRLRADTLRARAFTDNAAFGALTTRDSHLPWFPSVEMPEGDGADTVDADTQFADWDKDDLATIIHAPDRPLPILSEAELDALLATPAAHAADSHELDDDWQDNAVWQETFWHDVDAYLQTVEDGDFHTTHDDVAPMDVASDIEIRDEAPGATHFWLPGDEADLALSGDGQDLFLVGGGDAGVVLVEDGAVHSMRTGRGTRMGEVVVSWSTDAWSDVDMMEWTRVATLSGVSQVRVEQTVTHDREVVIAGELSGSALSADRVRLVEATERGPREFPVRRLGEPEADATAWPFADLGGAGVDDGRLFV